MLDAIEHHLIHVPSSDGKSAMHGLRDQGRCYRADTGLKRPYSFYGNQRTPQRLGHYSYSRHQSSGILGEANECRAHYAPYWRWLALLGLAAAALGLFVGTAWPGPITGAAFPIGITILVAVAWLARPHPVTSSHAR
jgi:hypothetical protein